MAELKAARAFRAMLDDDRLAPELQALLRDIREARQSLDHQVRRPTASSPR
jgi:hypothetical protein